MDWKKYKDYLLSVIPGAKPASGGKVIQMRCFSCQDGKSASSAHFYISIPWNNNEPSMYYCHKCGCRGFVSHKELIAWGIYDKQIALELTEYNESLKLKGKANKHFNTQTYLIRNSYTTNDDKSKEKLMYLVDRVGYPLSYADLKQLKICLNLRDLLSENNIMKLTRYDNIVSDLDREFIGFISIDNAFLNMRRTCKEGLVYKEIDKRYVNYQIFDKQNTSQRFYTIPTKIDLNKPQRVKLHIAEGPMDILSVYLNLRNKEEGIYTSVAGNNYINNILYFLIDIGLPYIELHLYPDNDKFGTLDRMRQIINHIPDKTIPVYIHKNVFPGEKDFGVPITKIKESVMFL